MSTRKQSWKDSLLIYKDVRMLRILLLGAISGFPWVLIASTANNSNLPNSIAKLKIHFEKSDKLEKLPFGPIISPKPGPTFDIDVAAADIDVVKSKPLVDRRAVIIKKITIYKNINEIIDDKNFSSMLLFSYFILNIPLG